MIPHPFTRLVFAYGEPVTVPREAGEAELEALRVQVERGLQEAVRRAEESLTEEALWKA